MYRIVRRPEIVIVFGIYSMVKTPTHCWKASSYYVSYSYSEAYKIGSQNTINYTLNIMSFVSKSLVKIAFTFVQTIPNFEWSNMLDTGK